MFYFQVRSDKKKIEAAKRTDPDGHLIGARGRVSESTARKERSTFAKQWMKEVSCIWLLVHLK